jgi:hypothetical protein
MEVYKLYNNAHYTLDQFIGTSEKINTLYNEWWYNYIDNSGIKSEEKTAWIERKNLDKENTIKETVDLKILNVYIIL